MRPGAKFFIFLIILLPLAYLAASYIKGEDGIANAKKLLGMDGNDKKAPNEVYEVKGDDLQGITDDLTRLETENAKLREELFKCQHPEEIAPTH